MPASKSVTRRPKSTPVEEAFRLTEEELQAHVSSVSDILLVLDAEGRYLKIAKTNPDLLYQTAAEMLGKTLHDIFPRERADEFLGHIRRALTTGRTIQVEYSLPIGGELKSFAAAISPMPGGRVVWVARDITMHRRAEDALRFLFEASTVLASSLDVEATLSLLAQLAVPRIADWCFVDLVEASGEARRVKVAHADPSRAPLAEAAYRFAPSVRDEDPRGWVLQTGQSLLVPEVQADFLEKIARDQAHLRLLRDLHPRSVMLVPLTARGRVLGSLTMLTSESGRRYGPGDADLVQELARRAALAVDNARLFQQAQDAIRSREQFLAEASHELRTPMAVLQGYHELLTAAVKRLLRSGEGRPADSDDRAALERALQKMERAIGRLVRLVDELLDVGRLLKGPLAITPERTNLSGFLDCVVEGIRIKQRRGQYGGQGKVQIEYTVPAEVWGTWDPGRLEQVLVNLLDNAVKYSPPEGTVTVTLAVETPGPGADSGTCAHLIVRDQGMGIPPEEQRRIFEPFTRAANVSERRLPGLGMGLAITKQIVDRHGGRIWVESAGREQGSTFHVLLPGVDAA